MFCQELIWMIIVNKIKNLILNRYFSSFFNRILTPFSLFPIKKTLHSIWKHYTNANPVSRYHNLCSLYGIT